MLPTRFSLFPQTKIKNTTPEMKTSSFCRFIRPMSQAHIDAANHALSKPCDKKRQRTQRIVPINHITSAIDPFTLLEAERLRARLPSVSLRMERILDLPDISQNNYHHPLAVNKAGSTFVALASDIYRTDLDFVSSIVFEAESDDAPQISALACLEGNNVVGTNLVYANQANKITIMDVEKRVGTWAKNIAHLSQAVLQAKTDTEFFVGNQTGLVAGFDSRRNKSSFSINASTDVICSLAYDNNRLLAVGCMTNQVLIYDIRNMTAPVIHYNEHQSDVKALSFSANGQLLASGGGNGCHQLNIWQPQTGKTEASFNTGSAITAVHWLDKSEHLCITSHKSEISGEINVWHYNQNNNEVLTNVGKTEKHQTVGNRYLDFKLNPKSNAVVAVSNNERLTFFKPSTPEQLHNKRASVMGKSPFTLSMPVIR